MAQKAVSSKTAVSAEGSGRARSADTLGDVLAALELHRVLALGVSAALAVAGVVIASLFPGLLPPEPIVGAAVGVAAVAFGVLAAVGADAGDRVVRGARHVRATGATVLAGGPDPLPSMVAWAESIIEKSGGGVRIAVLAAGADVSRAGQLAEALGTALAKQGRRVVVADLTRPTSDEPGLAEVDRGQGRLAEVAAIDATLDLARVSAGYPLVDGLVALPRLAGRLTTDVDALVAALPGLRHPGALLAATAAERSILLVIEGQTTRVDVLAGLSALDTASSPGDIVILPGQPPDPSPTPRRRSASPSVAATSPPGVRRDDVPRGDAPPHGQVPRAVADSDAVAHSADVERPPPESALLEPDADPGPDPGPHPADRSPQPSRSEVDAAPATDAPDRWDRPATPPDDPAIPPDAPATGTASDPGDAPRLAAVPLSEVAKVDPSQPDDATQGAVLKEAGADDPQPLDRPVEGGNRARREDSATAIRRLFEEMEVDEGDLDEIDLPELDLGDAYDELRRIAAVMSLEADSEHGDSASDGVA